MSDKKDYKEEQRRFRELAQAERLVEEGTVYNRKRRRHRAKNRLMTKKGYRNGNKIKAT